MRNFSSIFKNKNFYKILLLVAYEIFVIAYLPVAIVIFLSFKHFFNSFLKYRDTESLSILFLYIHYIYIIIYYIIIYCILYN